MGSVHHTLDAADGKMACRVDAVIGSDLPNLGSPTPSAGAATIMKFTTRGGFSWA